jgi:hypothetical protein
MINISESNIHLPLLHHNWYLDVKTPACSSPIMIHQGQVIIDPSSTTIMIHTTLCVFNELTLIIIINSFFSFFLNEVLLIFMTFKMCNHIGYNICHE